MQRKHSGHAPKNSVSQPPEAIQQVMRSEVRASVGLKDSSDAKKETSNHRHKIEQIRSMNVKQSKNRSLRAGAIADQPNMQGQPHLAGASLAKQQNEGSFVAQDLNKTVSSSNKVSRSTRIRSFYATQTTNDLKFDLQKINREIK